ncbi:hypothetical protein HMPREF9621_00345 [Cutibacterium modestum HL037PA2]|nr:hypothetical protein HMPREF9621_00345 [Cutibacterium modestum HL037PA2]
MHCLLSDILPARALSTASYSNVRASPALVMMASASDDGKNRGFDI